VKCRRRITRRLLGSLRDPILRNYQVEDSRMPMGFRNRESSRFGSYNFIGPGDSPRHRSSLCRRFQA
jgi:hypothetical protein